MGGKVVWLCTVVVLADIGAVEELMTGFVEETTAFAGAFSVLVGASGAVGHTFGPFTMSPVSITFASLTVPTPLSNQHP